VDIDIGQVDIEATLTRGRGVDGHYVDMEGRHRDCPGPGYPGHSIRRGTYHGARERPRHRGLQRTLADVPLQRNPYGVPLQSTLACFTEPLPLLFTAYFIPYRAFVASFLTGMRPHSYASFLTGMRRRLKLTRGMQGTLTEYPYSVPCLQRTSVSFKTTILFACARERETGEGGLTRTPTHNTHSWTCICRWRRLDSDNRLG
jgi:hypothetical protein